MNRREFLRQAAVLGGAAVLAACGPAEKSAAPTGTAVATQGATAAATETPPPTTRVQPPTSNPSPTVATASPTATRVATVTPVATHAVTSTAAPEVAWLGRVALVKTTDRADGVRRAIALLGINEIRGNRVLLKPNFNSADPAPGSTHPDILRSLVTELQAMGAKQITVGDRSGMGQTRLVMQQLGVFDLGKRLGFSTVVYDELKENEWALQQTKDYHWSRGFAVPRLLLDADAVVQTCNLKTHRFGGHFTLSLKNSVGFVAKQVGGTGYNYMSELHGSEHQRAMIAEINRVYRPSLVVMDAVEAFADRGPDRGRIVQPGVVLASLDRVALDAAGVAILRMHNTTPQVSQGKVFEQDQIARAVELELGVRRPEEIRLVTEDAEGEAFAEEIRRRMT